MTEAEWLGSDRARPMLRFLRGRMADRKLRLFACACWRSWPPIREYPSALEVLDLVERYADGLIPRPAHVPKPRNSIDAMVLTTRSDNAYSAACKVYYDLAYRENGWIVRDIFGNPFRPVAFDPAWRTETAVLLARQMYDSRDFGAMPILADALQDAGCESEEILSHCRDANQVHVRGCWVVDLVLGKE